MCDTFIALPQATSDSSVIFGKNSDREANESQNIEYHPSRTHTKNTILKCTYIKIPQVKYTRSIIISRPFWMWGAEMGVNDKGLVIGNEAVFTKLKVKKSNVLTGMDLLRLALERSDSALEAKHIIIDLLQQYDQGGICAYNDKDFTYHNSFLIADKNESWVLETAGKFWVTKKVKNYYAISNGLTIGSDYDEVHPDAINYALKKGWVRGEFDFSQAFSDFLYTKFSACKKRQSRAVEILKLKNKKIDIKYAMAHLRDHNALQYKPSSSLLSTSICSHAANSVTRNTSQTTSSMIVHLTKNKPTVWVTASAAPCLSVFKPLWFGAVVLPDLGPQLEASFEARSFWWQHEILHRTVLKDYKKRHKIIFDECDSLENELIEKVYHNKEKSFEITEMAFKKNKELIDNLILKIKNSPIESAPNVFYKNYWNKLNKKINLPF